MNTVRQRLQDNVRKIVLATTLAGTGVGVGGYLLTTPNYLPAKEALSHPVGEKVLLKMKVGEVRDFGPRVGLLVSDIPFRESRGEGMNTIRVTPDTKGYDQIKTLVGKTILVKGMVDEYRGKKQLLAEEVIPASK